MATRSNKKSWLDDLLGDEDDDQEVQTSRPRGDEASTPTTTVTSSTASLESTSTRPMGRRATTGKSVRFMDSFVEEDTSNSVPVASTPQVSLPSTLATITPEPSSSTIAIQVGPLIVAFVDD